MEMTPQDILISSWNQLPHYTDRDVDHTWICMYGNGKWETMDTIDGVTPRCPYKGFFRCQSEAERWAEYFDYMEKQGKPVSETEEKQNILDLSSMTKSEAFAAIDEYYKPKTYFEQLRDESRTMDFEHLVWDIASTVSAHIEDEESRYKQQDPALSIHINTVLDKLGIKKPE